MHHENISKMRKKYFSLEYFRIQWIPLLENGLVREARPSNRSVPHRCTWSQNRSRWTVVSIRFPTIEFSRNFLYDLSRRCRRPLETNRPIPRWFLGWRGTSTFLFPGVGEEKSKGPSAWPQRWTLEEDWRRVGKKGQPPCPTKKNADYPNGCPGSRYRALFLGLSWRNVVWGEFRILHVDISDSFADLVNVLLTIRQRPIRSEWSSAWFRSSPFTMHAILAMNFLISALLLKSKFRKEE